MKYFVVIVLLLTTAAIPASAQTDWFGKARGLLNSDTGKAASQLLNSGAATSTLSNTDIASGLREALTIGTKAVVSQLGQTDGFFGDSNIAIPLPGQLGRVEKALSAIGLSSMTDDLKLRMNRAAEAAVPKAQALFIEAIQDMTLDDAKNILNGPETAATDFLRKSMGPRLLQEMEPIIKSAIAQAGAVQAYDSVIGRYGQIPFVPDVKANMQNYVGEKALDGIFHYVAQEEKSIRENPAARTTDLLKSVFAGQ